MALHISGKLCALGVVLASLITAFSAPPRAAQTFDLSVVPSVTVLTSPRLVVPGTPSVGPVANPVFTVKATGYNSHVSQTDSTPDITATGTKTRFGIIAVSRDLLGEGIPYGSLVKIRDLGNFHNSRGAGRFQNLLDEQAPFVVEDTMHARKRNQIDVWFPEQSVALGWGVRTVEVELVRYGYDGPEIFSAAPPDFDAAPRLAAAH